VNIQEAKGNGLAKFAKVLIMLVRLVAIIEIGLGIWIAAGSGFPYLKAHIGLGFVMALSVFLLAVIAAGRRVYGLAIIGIVLAILIPVVGFKQLPLPATGGMGAIQYAHVIAVLAAIGVAEALSGRLKRSA
jgi:hypothetical protein